MKKIKVVMITDCLQLDGISSVIMNYCNYINLNMFDITIITGSPLSKIYQSKCNKIGIKTVELPSRKKSSKSFYFLLNKKLGETQYDICHVHGNSSTNTIELAIAKHNHINIRIMHCHTSKCQHEIIHRFLLPVFKRIYTDAFACSPLAGNWIFGEGQFTVIPNGFLTEDFKFNIKKRDQYREQLNMNGNLVIGHVGEMNYSKNQIFAIKCFEEFLKTNPSSMLLMVGNGKGKKAIEEYVDKLKFRDKIIIYGESNDVPGLLSAMDIFLFPSRYEGFGIAMVEAQINGLPCIASDAVPREAAICPNVYFLPIDNIVIWKEQIINIIQKEYDRDKNFELYHKDISKYDINNCARSLEQKYMAMFQTSGRRIE